MNQVPEKLNDFRVYRDGNDLLGVADVSLPDIEFLSETVKGAGIAGEVDSPTVGQLASMQLSLNWRTITKPLTILAQQKAHALDLRGSMQIFEAAMGEYRQVPVKIAVRGLPKKIGLGKFDKGSSTDSSSEFEVIYMKISINGETVIEIDKYNYVCVINGVDYLLQVRIALGLV